MADEQKQQQQPQQGEFTNIQPLDATQTQPGVPAPTSAAPVSGQEFVNVVPLDQPTPVAATQPAPKESWGTRALETVGRAVPERAPAAAQKVQEAAGSLIPEWAMPVLGGFQKYVNEPLNRMASKGAEMGKEIAGGYLQSASGGASGMSPNPRQAPLTMEQTRQQHPYTLGAVETIGEMAGGLAADPRNWPLLGTGAARPLLQKAISGYFAANMTKDAADTLTDAAARWDQMSPEEKSQAISKATAAGAFGALAGAHALGGTHPVRTVGEVARRIPEVLKGEEGADIGYRTGRGGAIAKGPEQYQPEALPKQYGAPKVEATPRPAAAGEYREPTPFRPEPGLMASGETEPTPRPYTAKPFEKVEPGEYRETTPTAPAEGLVTGPEQYEIRARGGETARPEAKSTGYPQAYSEPTEFTPEITKEKVDEIRAERKPETDRRDTEGERRVEEGESPTGEERRKAERRVLNEINQKAFQESAFGGEKKGLDTDAYANAMAQARKELGPDANVKDVMKRRDEIVSQTGGGESKEEDIGSKVRAAAPEPTRKEVAEAATSKAQRDNIVNHIESGKDFAILQAENPQNNRISNEENAKLTAQLKQELINKGYKPVEVGGNTKDVEGVKENAFFVPDITPEDAAALGKKYQQQGIVTNKGLRDLNTNKETPLDLSKGLLKGDEARKQQYYTTIGGEDYHFPMKEGEAQNSVRDAAETVNKNLGKTKINNVKVELDPNREKIADAYSEAKHNPNDPKVKASYDALKKETMDQWKELEKQGYTLEPSKEDPYKTYEDMAKDIKDNKRIKVWTGAEPPADHPMSEIEPTTGLPYNTIFRAVHDVMGHTAGDNDFSEKGEENAWKRHSQSYSDAALPAMTTETKGQTSTFFNGKDVREGKAEPHFPEQKATLLPEELYKPKPKDVEAEKLKQVAKPQRDTDIIAKIKEEHPDWSLSQQLMEAGRRAQKAEEAAPETESGGEHYNTVQSHVGDLTNNNLRELAKAVGIDPSKYDFSKRVAMREGGSKHPVERTQLVKDIMTKLKPEDIEKIGEQSKTAAPENVGGSPARSQKARSEDAEKLLSNLWNKPEEGGGGQFVGKGPAPEATSETAKMSNEELLKHGFTQEDIDAGKNIPGVGGGGPGEAKKMAGMEKIPEKITSKFLTEEEKSLKTEKSQQTAAKKLLSMPKLQEFVDIANQGAGERKWYQRGTAAVKEIANELPDYFDKPGDQDKFLSILASLSPRQEITENFTEAVRAWKELKDAEKSGIDLNEKLSTRRPAGYPKGEEWTHAGKILYDTIGMNKKSKIPNALRAVEGKSALEMWPDLSKNRYFKVPSFAANLAGFLDKVTSDGWMAAFAGMTPGELSNASSYHPLAAMTRAAADELGWEPAEAQTAIWAVVKTLTEKGETEPAQIRKYSKDFAEIAQSDAQIRSMLQDMGVDLEKLDERLKSIESKPEISSRSTSTSEGSIGKLTKRLEGQGREIPEPRSKYEAGDLNFEGDTSFNPEEYKTPITDSLIKKYGTTTEPYGSAQFITESGDRIPVQDHDVAVARALGNEDKPNVQDRTKYINDENVIRMRTRSSRTAAKEVVFSMPVEGEISKNQIKAIKDTVKKMGPYGMAYLEEAKPGGNYVTLTNAKPEDVDSAVKELYKPKGKWSSLTKAFHEGGEE